MGGEEETIKQIDLWEKFCASDFLKPKKCILKLFACQ